MGGGRKSKLVDCPRCRGGQLRPYLGECESVIGCRLCEGVRSVPDYLAGAYGLLLSSHSVLIPSMYETEELRCQVVGRAPTKNQ
jgi:hypothetical protein